jgi:uncharacterized membrane protein (Fun14 family)
MAGLGVVLGGFSGGKGRLLLIAAFLTGAGFFLKSTDLFSTGKPLPSASSSHKTVNSQWRETSKSQSAMLKQARTWGDAAARFGMSFGIAMIAGSLLRAFFKTMLTVFLVSGVALFLLYTQGLIDPFWETYFRAAEEATEWAATHKNTIQQFLEGYVPSITAALIGFGFGLRK